MIRHAFNSKRVQPNIVTLKLIKSLFFFEFRYLFNVQRFLELKIVTI